MVLDSYIAASNDEVKVARNVSHQTLLEDKRPPYPQLGLHEAKKVKVAAQRGRKPSVTSPLLALRFRMAPIGKLPPLVLELYAPQTDP